MGAVDNDVLSLGITNIAVWIMNVNEGHVYCNPINIREPLISRVP